MRPQRLKMTADVTVQKCMRFTQNLKQGVSKSCGECEQTKFQENKGMLKMMRQSHLYGNDLITPDTECFSEDFLHPCATFRIYHLKNFSRFPWHIFSHLVIFIHLIVVKHRRISISPSSLCNAKKSQSRLNT